MHTQLLEFFQAGNFLTESQSGFRPNHSTCTALISAVNLWLTNMDAGKLNVFIDLKQAFDTVDHNILLHKLCCYGVNGNALQLFKSYILTFSEGLVGYFIIRKFWAGICSWSPGNISLY